MSKKNTADILEKIYQEYADMLYSYGCKFTDDKGIVKDCIHDVFLRIYEKSDLSVIQNMRYYLLRSLKNKLIDELSKTKPIIITDDLPFNILHQPCVETSFLEEEKNIYIKNKIATALKCLTERQREAIYLYYIEELDYESICELMNMNYQSVRNLIHRSISRLRQNFGQTELMAICTVIHLIVSPLN